MQKYKKIQQATARRVDSILLDGIWNFIGEWGYLEQEFSRYLNETFGLKKNNNGCFKLEKDEALGNSFSIQADENCVTFKGGNDFLLGQAVFKAMDIMDSFLAPCLKKKACVFKPVFKERITYATKEYESIIDVLRGGYTSVVIPDAELEAIFAKYNIKTYLITEDLHECGKEKAHGVIISYNNLSNGLAEHFFKEYKHVILNISGAKIADKNDVFAKLPENVVIADTFFGEEYIERDGVKLQTCADSVIQPEASAHFNETLAAAKNTGHKVFAITPGAGRTLETPFVKYIPAMMQHLLRVDAIKQSGADGILNSSFFERSIVSAFIKEQLLMPCKEAGVSVQELTAFFFGSENTEKMMLIYKKITDGVNYMLFNALDRQTVCRASTAYPLLCEENEEFVLHDAKNDNNDITLETDCILKAADSFNKASEMLKNSVKNSEAEKLSASMALTANMLVTAANSKRWQRRREALKNEKTDFKKKFLKEQMIKIANDEILNAYDSAELLARFPENSTEEFNLDTLEKKVILTSDSLGILKRSLIK